MQLNILKDLIKSYEHARRWFNHDRDLFDRKMFRGNILLDCLADHIPDILFDKFLRELDDYFIRESLDMSPTNVMEDLRAKNDDLFLVGNLLPTGAGGAVPARADVHRNNCHTMWWLENNTMERLCRSVRKPEHYRAHILGTGDPVPTWDADLVYECYEDPYGKQCCFNRDFVWAAFYEEVRSQCSAGLTSTLDCSKLLEHLGMWSAFDIVFIKYPLRCTPCYAAKPTFIEGASGYFRVSVGQQYGRTAHSTTGLASLREIIHSCHGYWSFPQECFETVTNNGQAQKPDRIVLSQRMTETISNFGYHALNYFGSDW